MKAARFCDTSLFDQSLKHRVRGIFVKLDTDFGPKVVGKVIELTTRRNWHQQGLRLFVDSKLGNSNCVRNHFYRSAQIKSAGDHSATTCVTTEQAATQGDKDGNTETSASLVRVHRAHL